MEVRTPKLNPFSAFLGVLLLLFLALCLAAPGTSFIYIDF